MGDEIRTLAVRSVAAARPRVPAITLAARAFLVIVLGTASFFLCVAQFVFPRDREAFLVANSLDLNSRLQAIGLAALLGSAFATLVFVLSRRSFDAAGLRISVSKVVAPFSVTCFVPDLFVRDAWLNRDIAYLVLLLAVGLSLERLLNPAFEVIHERYLRSNLRSIVLPRLFRWIPAAVVLALVGFYIYRIGVLTNVSHNKLATMSSDLAEYDNLFFNALRGHPFRSPAIAGNLKDWSTLQGHAEFGLYFLLPFYALSPGAHALLWIQTSLVALTAVPVFLLGAARLGRIAGTGFAIAYLMMPAVQQPNFYDFHFTPLGMLFVAWLLYFVFRLSQAPSKRVFRIATYVTLGFALLCREDIGIGIAVLGTFLVLSGVLVRDGIILTGVAGFYFATMKFGIMPLVGHWWFDTMYNDLKAEGAKGFGAVLLTLVSNPSFTLRTMLTEPKFLYVLHMTVPLLALWLRRPLLWLALLPGFVATLLVTNRPPMFQASFQYTYFWVPYVIGASILATRRGVRGSAAATALVLVALAVSHHFGVFPSGERIVGGFGVKTFAVNEAEAKQIKDLNEIIALIPPEASVSATETEGPHVSSRLVMYSLKYTLGDDPDYLLVGQAHHRGEKAHLREALQSGKYGVVAQRGRFVLAKKGANPDRNTVLWQRIGGRHSR